MASCAWQPQHTGCSALSLLDIWEHRISSNFSKTWRRNLGDAASFWAAWSWIQEFSSVNAISNTTGYIGLGGGKLKKDTILIWASLGQEDSRSRNISCHFLHTSGTTFQHSLSKRPPLEKTIGRTSSARFLRCCCRVNLGEKWSMEGRVLLLLLILQVLFRV